MFPSDDMKDVVVGFDLDDTLAPEALFLKSAIAVAARYLSERFPTLSAFRIEGVMWNAVTRHMNHYSALEDLLEKDGLSKFCDMKEIVAMMRNHKPDPAIYHLAPSVKATLNHLHDEGIAMALITDGRSTTQRNKIQTLGLDRYIEEKNILISEETGYDKHHAVNFISVMNRNPGKSRFIYIGDNPAKDFVHPHSLGWQTYCLPAFPLAIHQKREPEPYTPFLLSVG